MCVGLDSDDDHPHVKWGCWLYGGNVSLGTTRVSGGRGVWGWSLGKDVVVTTVSLCSLSLVTWKGVHSLVGMEVLTCLPRVSYRGRSRNEDTIVVVVLLVNVSTVTPVGLMNSVRRR